MPDVVPLEKFNRELQKPRLCRFQIDNLGVVHYDLGWSGVRQDFGNSHV